MILKEGIDYHIRNISNFKELTSVILSGFCAGIVDLTRRGYDINETGIQTIGNLLVARTLPKKKPSKTKTSKKATAKEKETKAEEQSVQESDEEVKEE